MKRQYVVTKFSEAKPADAIVCAFVGITLAIGLAALIIGRLSNGKGQVDNSTPRYEQHQVEDTSTDTSGGVGLMYNGRMGIEISPGVGIGFDGKVGPMW